MNLKRLALPAYLVGALLILIPLGEGILSTRPMTPGALTWRYGASGVLSSALLTPVLGLLLVAFVATLVEHRRMLRTTAILSLAGATILTFVVGLFVLDALQLRSQIIAEARVSYQWATAQALFRMLALLVTCAVLGVAAWKSSRRHGTEQSKKSRSPRNTLLRRPSDAPVEPLEPASDDAPVELPEAVAVED